MITSSFEHDSHKVRHHKFRGPVLFYFMFLCVSTYMHCHIYPNHFHFHNFPKMQSAKQKSFLFDIVANGRTGIDVDKLVTLKQLLFLYLKF